LGDTVTKDRSPEAVARDWARQYSPHGLRYDEIRDLIRAERAAFRRIVRAVRTGAKRDAAWSADDYAAACDRILAVLDAKPTKPEPAPGIVAKDAPCGCSPLYVYNGECSVHRKLTTTKEPRRTKAQPAEAPVDHYDKMMQRAHRHLPKEPRRG
jgi:hypothetical protein